MNNYSEQDFLSAIRESFIAYKVRGSRSNEKLKPIHKYIAQILKIKFGNNYQYHYLGGENSELKVEGKYYPKNVDISISQNGSPIFCLGVKFVTSNFAQNANNYFENMMGETANIQANNIPYAQLIILRKLTPYYEKNAVLKKIEQISESQIKKYILLMDENDLYHVPKFMCIFVVDIDEVSHVVTRSDCTAEIGATLECELRGKLGPEKFFADIEELKKQNWLDAYPHLKGILRGFFCPLRQIFRSCRQQRRKI